MNELQLSAKSVVNAVRRGIYSSNTAHFCDDDAFYKYGCNCHSGLSMRPNKVDELENKDKKWQTWGIMREISFSNLETERYG